MPLTSSAPPRRRSATPRRRSRLSGARTGGEPLSRICGRREFWSLDLAISADVLDPRPETETIVEAARSEMAERREEALRVLDLGVGSGALLCALLSEISAASGLGVDLSGGAAAVCARQCRGARSGRIAATIRVGDWGAGLEGPFDLVVSNPPYIRADEIAGLDREVRDHDPRLALDGGAEACRLIAAGARRPWRDCWGRRRGGFFSRSAKGRAKPVLRSAAAGLEVAAVGSPISPAVARVVGGGGTSLIARAACSSRRVARNYLRRPTVLGKWFFVLSSRLQSPTNRAANSPFA